LKPTSPTLLFSSTRDINNVSSQVCRNDSRIVNS
jgi:hypothetical protein